MEVKWVTMALQTITPKHRDLRQITICLPHSFTFAVDLGNVREAIGEEDFEQWLDLDRLLVELWELRSIRPKVLAQGMSGLVGCLFPEITKGGIIGLVEPWRKRALLAVYRRPLYIM
jgi:hypothetical protein